MRVADAGAGLAVAGLLAAGLAVVRALACARQLQEAQRQEDLFRQGYLGQAALGETQLVVQFDEQNLGLLAVGQKALAARCDRNIEVVEDVVLGQSAG